MNKNPGDRIMNEEYALKDHGHFGEHCVTITVICMVLCVVLGMSHKSSHKDWHKEMEAEQTPTTQPIQDLKEQNNE